MQVIKSSIIYLGSSILNKAIPFLLLPMLTKYLSPEEYGVLSIFQLMISFFTAFVGMAIHTNVSKNFFKYSKNQTSLMIGNILMILSLTTLIYFIITLGVSFCYQEIFSVPSNWVGSVATEFGDTKFMQLGVDDAPHYGHEGQLEVYKWLEQYFNKLLN